MQTNGSNIFREVALKHYLRGPSKDILPRFVSPRAFLYFWILFGLCVIAGILAWNTPIPIYETGEGTLVINTQQSQEENQMLAVIFLAPDQLSKVKVGQSVQVKVGTTGLYEQSTIMTVEQTLLSPIEARKRYRLDGTMSLLVKQPATVVTVALDRTMIPQTYAGSIVQAQIQVGSQRVLFLLPVIGKLLGSEQ